MSEGRLPARPGSLAAARWTAVAAILLIAGSAGAQIQGQPVDGPARGASLLAPVAMPACEAPAPAAGAPLAERVMPGWPGPERPPEAPQCDDPFRFATRGGSTYTGLPRTLLWEPPLANLREPRFLLLPNTFSSAYTRETIDTAIGNTLGLVRYEPVGGACAVQLDFFGVVYSRFSERDFFVTSDYRAGFPLTFAAGPWQAKFGYEHTSTHLGDETIVRTGRAPFDYIKDELVFGLGRYFLDRRLRLYGDVGWAVFQYVPGDPSPFRFDIGAEWVRRRDTGCRGQPFAATNLGFDGAVGYSPNFSLQAGWMWRDPARRLAEARLFGQFYTGHSLYGQFFQTRETWFGLGLALDY